MTREEKEVRRSIEILNVEQKKFQELPPDTPEWITQGRVYMKAWDKFQECAAADWQRRKNNPLLKNTKMNLILNTLFVGTFLRMWKAAWYFLLMLLLPALYENYFASNSDGIWEPFSIWAFWICLLAGIYSCYRSYRYES